MPSSVLRHTAALIPPLHYPNVQAPWVSGPWRQVDRSTPSGIIQAAGGSNVKSAWVDLFASLANECDAIVLTVAKTANPDTGSAGHLVSLATGTAGNEVVIVPNAACGQAPTMSATSTNGAYNYMFPVHVDKGVRVSFAAQSEMATPPSAWWFAYAMKLGHGRSPTYLTNYGANTATSRGVVCVTNDVYVQITAATTEDYQALILTEQITTTDTSAGVNTSKLAVGAAAAEVEVLRTYHSTNYDEWQDSRCQNFGVVSGHFPKGTRIAGKNSLGSSYKVDFVVFGVPYT